MTHYYTHPLYGGEWPDEDPGDAIDRAWDEYKDNRHSLENE